MDIPKVLMHIRPGAEWCLRGDTLEGLEWLDQVQTQPTSEEMDAGWLAVQGLLYKDERRPKYPYFGDQLDAMWKSLQHMKANGVDLGSDADAMINDVNAIKTQYPKPE